MQHHLAILRPNYIDDIIVGSKTIECRLGRAGYPPHGYVQPGDLLWLKEVSGPVRAAVRAEAVESIPLDGPGSLETLRRAFNDRIGAPAAFWRREPWVQVATLITLGDVCVFRPFRVHKRDRRAWVPFIRPPKPDAALRTVLRRTTTAR